MTVSAGAVGIKVTGDESSLVKAMNNALSKINQIPAAAAKAGSAMNDLGNKVSKAAASFDGISKIKDGAASVAKAATVITGALAGIGGLAVKMASDFNETTNVLQFAFGDQADAAEKWAADTAKAMGRSTQQMREMAGGIQALLVPMVGSVGASADMSKSLAGLAVDLGSFFNIADNDALVALKAGLVGESEPMRKFGVNMTEASLQSFALSKGIGTLVSKMSDSEKVALRYQFIMDKTQLAQGDAIRTGGGLANSMKALEGAFSDAGRSLGQELVPLVTDAVHGLTDLVRKFNDLDPGVKRGIVAVGVFAAGLAGLIAVGATAVVGIASIAQAFASVSAAATAAGTTVGAAGASIAAGLGTAALAAGAFVAAFALTSKVLDELGVKNTGVEGGLKALGSAFDSLTEGVNGFFTVIVNGIAAITSAFLSFATGGLSNVLGVNDAIEGMAASITSTDEKSTKFGEMVQLDEARQRVGALTASLVDLREVMDPNGFQEADDAIGDFGIAVTKVDDDIQAARDTLKGAFVGAWKEAGKEADKFDRTMEQIADRMKQAAADFKKLREEAARGAGAALATGGNANLEGVASTSADLFQKSAQIQDTAARAGGTGDVIGALTDVGREFSQKLLGELSKVPFEDFGTATAIAANALERAGASSIDLANFLDAASQIGSGKFNDIAASVRDDLADVDKQMRDLSKQSKEATDGLSNLARGLQNRNEISTAPDAMKPVLQAAGQGASLITQVAKQTADAMEVAAQRGPEAAAAAKKAGQDAMSEALRSVTLGLADAVNSSQSLPDFLSSLDAANAQIIALGGSTADLARKTDVIGFIFKKVAAVAEEFANKMLSVAQTALTTTGSTTVSAKSLNGKNVLGKVSPDENGNVEVAKLQVDFQSIGQAAGSAAGQLATLATGIPGLEQVFGLLGSVLGAGANQSSAFVNDLIKGGAILQGFFQGLQPLFTALEPIFGMLIQNLGIFLGGILDVINSLMPFINIISSVVTTMMSFSQGFMKGFFKVILIIFNALSSLVEVLQPVINVMMMIGGVLMQIFSGPIIAAMELGAKIMATAILAVTAALQFFGVIVLSIAEFIMGLVKGIVDAVYNMIKGLLGEDVANAALGGLKSGIDGVVDGLAEMKDALGDPADTLQQIADLWTKPAEQAATDLNDLDAAIQPPTENLNKLNESAENLPQGFKVAQARFRAITADGGSTSGSAPGASDSGRHTGGKGETNNYYIGSINANGMTLDSMASEIHKRAEMITMGQTGTTGTHDGQNKGHRG